MILDKLFLRIQDDLSLVGSVVTAGIGFLVGVDVGVVMLEIVHSDISRNGFGTCEGSMNRAGDFVLF